MDAFDPETFAEFREETNRDYQVELFCLQAELLNLQKHIKDQKLRLAVVFEGRDTAGKGGAILRFSRHLIPRYMRVVALVKPTDEERGQWYFQRYIRHLPNAGNIVFFDRSWYNRAVVEPVMGFCTPAQHELFMEQVNTVERMWVEDGIVVVKFWFSIETEEQEKRLEDRQINPIKTWKLSPVDQAAQDKWEAYTKYKEKMFRRTSTEHCPWVRVDGNDKRTARLESMRYVLSLFDYPDKGFTGVRLDPDPAVVQRVLPDGSAQLEGETSG